MGGRPKNYVICVCTAVNVSASGGLRTLDPLQTHTSLPPCYKILAAPLTVTEIAVDLRPSADGSAVRTSPVAGGG